MHLNKLSWLLALKLVNALQDDVMTNNIILLNISNTSIKLFKAAKDRQLYINIPITSDITGKDKTGLFILDNITLNKYIDKIIECDIAGKKISSTTIKFNADDTVSITTQFIQDNKTSRISRKIKYIEASLDRITTRGIAIQATNMLNRITEYEKKSEIDVWETVRLQDIIQKMLTINSDNIYISPYTETAAAIIDRMILEVPLNNTIHNTVIISDESGKKLSSALNILLNHKLENTNINKNILPNIDNNDLYNLGSDIASINLGGTVEVEPIEYEDIINTTQGTIDIFSDKKADTATGLDGLPILNYPYLTVQLLKPFDSTDAIIKTIDGEVAIQVKQSLKSSNSISVINNTIMNNRYIAYSIIDKQKLLTIIRKFNKKVNIEIKFRPNIESKTKSAHLILKQDSKQQEISTLHFYENNYLIFGYTIKIDKITLVKALEQLDTDYISMDINSEHLKLSSLDIGVLSDAKNNNWPLHELVINRRQDIQTKRVYINYGNNR